MAYASSKMSAHCLIQLSKYLYSLPSDPEAGLLVSMDSGGLGSLQLFLQL